MENLTGVKVAILIEQGFEQVEMVDPRKALDQAGAETSIVSPRKGEVRGWNHTEWGEKYPVDVPLEQARAEDYDALVLPGGVMNPDKLRMEARAVEFVRTFFDRGKPVAAICHGPWLLVEAGVAREGASLPGHPLKPICGMPVRSGWIKRWWWMETWCPAESPMIFRHSTER